MKSILDKSFRYVPAAATDVKATFERVKKEREEQKRREQEQKLDRVIKWRPNGTR
jgi:hypothetical protein